MQTIDIPTFVAKNGQPAVISLEEDMHVFHFADMGAWQECPLLLVNRNGNHFRLIKQDDRGDWLFAKSWNGLFDTQPWQIEANLRRPDPKFLMNLCGIGPQGTRGAQFEALSLLPRDATTRRRKAVWRQHTMDVSFDRNSDQFTLLLSGPNGGEDRHTFGGKLWESQEAAKFCAQHFSDKKPQVTFVAVKKVATPDQALALEKNPLWGMF